MGQRQKATFNGDMSAGRSMGGRKGRQGMERGEGGMTGGQREGRGLLEGIHAPVVKVGPAINAHILCNALHNESLLRV